MREPHEGMCLFDSLLNAYRPCFHRNHDELSALPGVVFNCPRKCLLNCMFFNSVKTISILFSTQNYIFNSLAITNLEATLS